jgi:hypothetical protein
MDPEPETPAHTPATPAPTKPADRWRLVSTPARAAIAGAAAAIIFVAVPCGIAGVVIGTAINHGWDEHRNGPGDRRPERGHDRDGRGDDGNTRRVPPPRIPPPRVPPSPAKPAPTATP